MTEDLSSCNDTIMNKIYLFDWGDTLMVDFPNIPGKMCDWPKVEATKYAQETLQRVSQRADIYIATAASSSTASDIESAFKRVGLDSYIRGYFCKQNTGFTKPAPEFYKAILKYFGIAPTQVTMVGDDLKKDILPCRELGIQTIWLTSENVFPAPKGVTVIRNLRELPDDL